MLIHKTMTMPTSCLSCWISPTCEVWVREKSKYKGYDNRLDECPLEEVKHGHWTSVVNGRGGFECSACHQYAPSYQNGVEWLSNYCPHCGAKMDEVKTNETN